jgi:hypothetical protein
LKPISLHLLILTFLKFSTRNFITHTKHIKSSLIAVNITMPGVVGGGGGGGGDRVRAGGDYQNFFSFTFLMSINTAQRLEM